jgi:hypothetical protein
MNATGIRRYITNTIIITAFINSLPLWEEIKMKFSRLAFLLSFVLTAAVFFTACDQSSVLDSSAEIPASLSGIEKREDCELGVSDAQVLAEIEALTVEIDVLEASGALTSGQANALRNHLNNALSQFNAGRTCTAIVQLNAFRQQVTNFVNTGILEEDEAAPLLSGVSVVLDGPPPPPPLPNLVEILSPFGTTFEAAGAAFGPELTTTGVTAPFSYVTNEGCEADLFAGFPVGNIAVIDRGECSFVVKVANAEAAGASGVIIVNNVDARPTTLGGTEEYITIPSVMVSMSDGDWIKAEMYAGMTGNMRKKP